MSAILAKNEGGDFKQLSPATYPARCFQILDLGMQRNEWNGEEMIKHQLMVTWEVPSELLDDDQPMAISKFYTLSLHPKSNLGIDLVSWRGRAFSPEEEAGFDVSKLAGVPCLLSVIDKNGKSRVGSVMGLPKGTEVPAQINNTIIFSMSDYINGDTSVFDNLSEGLQNIILKSEDLKKPKPRAVKEESLEDDIPF